MKIYQTLEFNKIIEQLTTYALSKEAKERLEKLKPLASLDVIDQHLNEATEARRLADSNYRIPVDSLEGVQEFMDKVDKGRVLDPSDLSHCSRFLNVGYKMWAFMKDKDSWLPLIAPYAKSIYINSELQDRIHYSVVGNELSDQASPTLHKIRKKIAVLSDRIQNKLQHS